MTDLTPRWISQGVFQRENKRETRSGCRFRCEKRGERPDVMGWSRFSLSLRSPAWPRGPPLSVSHKDAVKCDDVIEAALLGAKPLCSARTTKKSLCSSDSKRIGQRDGRVHLFPRGRVTVLVHKPLIQPSGPYLFPPTAVIQASGKPCFFGGFFLSALWRD